MVNRGPMAQCKMLKPGQRSVVLSHRTSARVHRSRVMTRVSCQQGNGGNTKRLILMRHADSVEKAGIKDHDRPITEAGTTAASQVAAQLKAKGWIPEVVVCSNSLRSRQTLDAMRDGLQELENADSHFLGSLYTIAALDGQTRSHLQKIVMAEASNNHNTVLCLGHNMGWSEAAASFTASDVFKLGNCHAALLEIESSDWEDCCVDDAVWSLVDLVKPGVH